MPILSMCTALVCATYSLLGHGLYGYNVAYTVNGNDFNIVIVEDIERRLVMQIKPVTAIGTKVAYEYPNQWLAGEWLRRNTYYWPYQIGEYEENDSFILNTSN